MSQDDCEIRKTTMEGEHRVQFGLIRALQEAMEDRLDNQAIETVLKQLIDCSETHFLSEEQLMRRASYDDYEEHAENHRQLLDSLRTVLQQYQSTGRVEIVEQVAKSSMAFLMRHIQTRDVRFANWQRV